MNLNYHQEMHMLHDGGKHDDGEKRPVGILEPVVTLFP